MRGTASLEELTNENAALADRCRQQADELAELQTRDGTTESRARDDSDAELAPLRAELERLQSDNEAAQAQHDAQMEELQQKLSLVHIAVSYTHLTLPTKA